MSVGAFFSIIPDSNCNLIALGLFADEVYNGAKFGFFITYCIFEVNPHKVRYFMVTVEVFMPH